MAFSRLGAGFLAAYFLILAIFSGIRWYALIAHPALPPHLSDGVLVAFFGAVCISSIFYIRKLYKDLFASSVQKAATGATGLTLMATFLYFLARPLFAGAMAVLFTVVMYGFVHGVVQGEPTLSFGFLVFSTTASGFIAVGIGAGISRLEQFAKRGEGPFQYHV